MNMEISNSHLMLEMLVASARSMGSWWNKTIVLTIFTKVVRNRINTHRSWTSHLVLSLRGSTLVFWTRSILSTWTSLCFKMVTSTNLKFWTTITMSVLWTVATLNNYLNWSGTWQSYPRARSYTWSMRTASQATLLSRFTLLRSSNKT